MTATLVVTTRSMRKAVTKWLKEERATIQQALQLESALYAGLVDGSSYRGLRYEQGYDIGEDVNWTAERRKGITGEEVDESVYYPSRCGCLLDTIEQIKGGRR